LICKGSAYTNSSPNRYVKVEGKHDDPKDAEALPEVVTGLKDYSTRVAKLGDEKIKH
jgi:hypothetical protein